MQTFRCSVLLSLLLVAPISILSAPICSISQQAARFDCFPGNGASQAACEARGCCWNAGTVEKLGADQLQIGVPSCFFPSNYPSYNITSLQDTDFGHMAVLERTTSSGWPNDVKKLTLDVWYETPQRLRFKISDPSAKRYEVPIETPPSPRRKPVDVDYKVEFMKAPFGITVLRKSNGAVLFDSTVAPLIYADQFLQISSRLSSDLVYGLGEHKSTLLHNASNWQQLTLWAKDQAPTFNSNLYGSHPFYLNIEKDGMTHGAFLLNSNAMDLILQPLPAVTFRPIGGIIDVYIFAGPSSTRVVEQYVEVIGRPQLPPYWGLGFHLCRYNYNSIQNLKLVVDRNRKLEIPYDVQWNDIDYMSLHLDWTYDDQAYAGLPDLVKDLHDYGQKYVVIVDPGISNQKFPTKYTPYDSGVALGVFVQNSSGSLLVGKVWPGSTVFPDFTHPKSFDWWYTVAKDFHDELPFDGLWTDMNEPSDFVSGSVDGCAGNNLDIPPYTPGITGNGQLQFNTICPSAKQYYSSHYNLHNMYGLHEVIATNWALERILAKRSIVISRSSYPSLGKFGGHWTGDISSTWEDLYYSIPGILEFQFYGIPFVGADICGFGGDTTEELCTRWMQLGAFYPFMRNHNTAGSRDQDPGAWSVGAQAIMKSALELRYALLPFFYTQFFYSTLDGSPVIQPLFFRYPMEVETYAIDKQFLWGGELLISPVLLQGAVEVKAYFPADLWYDIYDGSLTSNNKAQWLTLKAPLERINVHVRGGSIIPMQRPAITTVLARKNPFGLLVAFNQTLQARGSLYWDDGESLDSIERRHFTFMTFEASKGRIESFVVYDGHRPMEGLELEVVRCLGVPDKPTSVTVNGKEVTFHYNDQELVIASITVDLLRPFNIAWH